MPQFRKKPIVIEAEQWLGLDSKIEGVYQAKEFPSQAEIDAHPEQARELLRRQSSGYAP